MSTVRRPFVLACSALLVLLASCATTPPKQTDSMVAAGVTEVTTPQMQVFVHDFGMQIAGALELTADEIVQRETDPLIRENAILWKVYGVPLGFQAAFTEDPMVALLNCWAFCVQMRQYFSEGAGHDAFGASQQLAIDTCEHLESRAAALAARVAPADSFDLLNTIVMGYADASPIASRLFVRPTASLDLLEAMPGSSVEGIAAAASMNEQLQALIDRANILAVSVPRQAGWQSELAQTQLPALTAALSDSVLARVDAETRRLTQEFMAFVEKERQAVMADVEHQLMTGASTLASERSTILTALASERAAILEHLTAERLETLREIQVMSAVAVAHTVTETEAASARIVDRAIDRAAMWMAVPVIAVILLSLGQLLVLRSAVQSYVRMNESRRPEGREKTTV